MLVSALLPTSFNPLFSQIIPGPLLFLFQLSLSALSSTNLRTNYKKLKINIESSSFCGEVQHLYSEYYVILKAINAKITKNSPPMELIVHDEVLWVEVENLSTFDWLEANKKLVKIIQNQS